MLTAALAVAGALGGVFAVLMLLQPTLYASALCLLVVLFQIAAVFYLLGVPLLAFLQVLIYAGAIMVLVVVAIMTAPPRLTGLWARLSVPRPLAAAVLAAAVLELALLGWVAFAGAPAAAFPDWPGQQQELAQVLFGPYAVMTEVVGLMVFLSALAVVEVWRPQRSRR